MRQLSKDDELDLLVRLHLTMLERRVFGKGMDDLLLAGREMFIETALHSYDELVRRGLPLEQAVARPTEAEMGTVYDRIIATVPRH